VRKITIIAVLALIAGGSIRAGASTERYVPFTPLGGGTEGIDMNEGHLTHKHLYVSFTKKGASRLMGMIGREDQARVAAVDFRRSVLVGVFLDYPLPEYCPERITLNRLRVHQRRVDAIAMVEMRRGCMGVPELVGTHVYALAEFPRRYALKRARAGNLFLRFKYL
jgi:hypothetical protein